MGEIEHLTIIGRVHKGAEKDLQKIQCCGIVKLSQGWLICPACGRGKVLRLLPKTECKELLVYCKVCKQESVVNISLVPEP